MLSHLQLGEVEPEGLDLPNQVLQLAECVTRGAGLKQRRLQHAQVVQERFGVAIGKVGVPGAGRVDAPGDEQEQAAVRFAGGALLDVGRRGLVGCGHAVEQALGCGIQRRRIGAERERASDSGCRALEAAEHVI